MIDLSRYTVETLPKKEFDTFFSWLPERVRHLVKARFVNWKEVLPEWFEKYKAENNSN